MASGNFISATGVNLNVYVVWSSTINVEGNYSTVYMDIYLRHYSLSCGAKSGSATADGSPQSFGTPAYSFGNYLVDTLMASKSFTVYHNSDGTKSCGLSAYWGFVGTYGGQSINGITAAATVTLDTIPRKSSISSLTPTVDVNGTNQVTVAISRASTSFTHKVTFSIGAYSQEYTGVATSQAFAIPLAWLNSIPNSVSGVANVRVETFSGATSLGYVDGAFTITAPATIIPTVTDIAFARDTTGTDPFTTYAKGISKVSVSGVSVTNQYSATTALIKTYLHLASVSYLTGILYNGSSFISAVIPSAGTMRLTTVVTDSRGRESVAYYEDFTVYDYFAPALTVTAFRCNSAGVADPSGEYLSATMVVNVAPVNNNNTKTYVLEYKKTTDSTWTPISTAALTGYSGSLNAVRAASSANTWEVRASITDEVGTVTKATAVGTKRVPINSGFSGTAVAIGKVAETADMFEVDLVAQLNKGIFVNNRLAKYYNTAAGDCNNITDEWHLGGNGSANYPVVGSGVWWYVNTIKYSTSAIKQIAYGYSSATRDKVYTRAYVSGSWQAWVELASTAVETSTALLWTNPSPTASFAAQTITVPNMSEYDMIEIMFEYATSDGHVGTSRVKGGKGGWLEATISGARRFRTFTIPSATQITFTDAKYNGMGSSSATTENVGAIPLYVIGFKNGLFI